MTFTEHKKIIAVIGSTGLQGGGLVRAILNDPTSPFVVRALTRDPTKEAAVALSAAGANVMKFDMDGPVDAMAQALEGVYGLFVVTNFWEHMDRAREMKQAQAVIQAGEKEGVQHYLWSTLEDTTLFFEQVPPEDRPPKIDGTYVPFFDAKGQTNQFFPQAKTTIIYTSAYLEDFYNFGWISDGVFVANLDSIKLPVIAVEDIGKSVYGVLKAGDRYRGETVYLATDRLTGDEFMEIASEVVGVEYQYKMVDRDTYANKIMPLVANMFEYMRQNPAYSAALDPVQAHQLTGGDYTTVRDFFARHKDKIAALGPNMEKTTETEE